MKKIIYRYLAKYFIKNKGREDAIPIGAPDCYGNNDIYVHLADRRYGERNYTLDRVEGNKVFFKRWESDSRKHIEDEFPINVLWEGDIRVSHFISRFIEEYSGLLKGYFVIITKWYKFKIWKSRRIQKTLKLRKTRIGLLEDLVSQHSENPTKVFTISDAMTFIYGSRVFEAEKTTSYYRFAQFFIRSLAFSGDLIPENNKEIELASSFIVSPKALKTIEEYVIEERRHKRATSISRGQLAITFMLLIVAALTLLFQMEIIKPQETKANKSVELTPEAPLHP